MFLDRCYPIDQGLFETIDPRDLAGVEYYPIASAPAQYRYAARAVARFKCLALPVWSSLLVEMTQSSDRARRARHRRATGLRDSVRSSGIRRRPTSCRVASHGSGEDPNARALVAEQNGALIGLATVHLRYTMNHEAPIAQLTLLVVDESNRTHGVGRALVEPPRRGRRTAGAIVSPSRRRCIAPAHTRSTRGCPMRTPGAARKGLSLPMKQAITMNTITPPRGASAPPTLIATDSFGVHGRRRCTATRCADVRGVRDRYATVPAFKVSGLIAGADTSRRIDIAMMVWLLKGPDGRNVLVDAGFHRGDFVTRGSRSTSCRRVKRSQHSA